jgi:hypothetical protein
MTRLLIPALAVLSACCKPVALPDTPRLHVVAAPSGGSASPAAAPSASPSGEPDNPEIYRPAQCVAKPIKADVPFKRKGE